MKKEKSYVEEGYVEKEKNRGKTRDGNGREKERERETKTSKLIYLNEATSGRRRLRATHGGNPYTRVPVRGDDGGTRIRSNTRVFHTRVRRQSATRYRARMAAIESTRTRERSDRAACVEWGRRRVCGATRIYEIYTRRTYIATRVWANTHAHTRATAPGPREQSSHLPDKM